MSEFTRYAILCTAGFAVGWFALHPISHWAKRRLTTSTFSALVNAALVLVMALEVALGRPIPALITYSVMAFLTIDDNDHMEWADRIAVGMSWPAIAVCDLWNWSRGKGSNES